jgi:hypothetical protein
MASQATTIDLSLSIISMSYVINNNKLNRFDLVSQNAC